MSPYRSLPVLPTRAVCVWCRHSHFDAWRRCNARRRAVPCPIEGTKIVDERRDCAVVNNAGDCPDFEPSIATRVLRWLGWRR